jgi:CDP-diacylglycerol--glycerol-3-phosphate 3-phosphatidyltransferase
MRNMPNILSSSRILATVFVYILIIVNQQWAYIIATIIFALASATDYFDGKLARRYKTVSPLGIFLDLTADKVFVSAILIALVQIGLVPGWITVIIVAREFLVTGLRSMAAAKGTVIPAGPWGKQKTFITLVALGGMLLAMALGAGLTSPHLSLFPPYLVFNSHTLQVGQVMLLVADVLLLLGTLWTIISGAEYMIGARPLFRNKPETSPTQA